jgi:D-alanine-D-alanine ligase
MLPIVLQLYHSSKATTNPGMMLFAKSIHQLFELPVKVWVLAPAISTGNENIDYYYDFSQSIAEYQKVFNALQIDWQWQPVCMQSYPNVIATIAEEKKKAQCVPIVLNLCDGDEVNGTPGIAVVKMLQQKKIIYTGASEYFYWVTTSKISMKQAFDKAHVATAKWMPLHGDKNYPSDLFEKLGTPIIVKPAVSGGSMGVGIKNVVHNTAQLTPLLQQLYQGYNGWNLTADGLIAETFIAGEEYTVFIAGDYLKPDAASIYRPVERVFHASLPAEERFLSFDRLWEIYEQETEMPNQDNFYEYVAVEDLALEQQIKTLAWDAYVATRGTGYTRVDIRRDAHTGKLYVLEVNAQCGISEDENFTSIGAILRINNASFTDLVANIIQHACERSSPVLVAKPAAKKIA